MTEALKLPGERDSQGNHFWAQAEKDLSRGLQFTNLLASIAQEKNAENTVLLQALVDLLISKGVIHYHELEEHKRVVAESISKKEAETPSVQLMETSDKYAAESEVLVDCASRQETCHAICCKLWFALSVQDLTEGVVRWNYGMPYGIAQDEEGFCIHQNHSTGHCMIYEKRPLVCRSFDCRNDRRIWQDFENKVLSQEAVAIIQKKADNG